MTASTHDDDPRLAELLLRWEELHDEGRSASPEELCSACPELAEELGRRIAILRQLDPLMDATTTADDQGPRPRATGASRRESATARVEFRDLRFHAAGALGEVFLARNAELNREVALKFIKPERSGDPDSRRRFLQEAEVTGRLEHPGVVPIYALGTDAGGFPCYAMRFIRGETLQSAIDAYHAAEKPGRDPSERSLALRELLNRLISICGTMGYAHSRGILHRDLKPRNVMLGKYEETLVVDWGLAKSFERDEASRSVGEETLTPSSGDGSDSPTVGAVGTPAYMSPEQAEARWDLVGPASDLFSLGAVLYAILTGRAPYQGRHLGEMLEKVKRCEFRPPRQVKPRVPRPLEAICLKAMARRPEDRYQTAKALSDDLEKWLAGEAVSAYREPWIDRARRWLGRRRTLMAAAAVGVGIATLSLGGAVVLLAGANQRERTLRAEAVAARIQAERAQAQAVSEKDRAERAQEQMAAQAKRAREEARKATMLADFLVRLFQSSDPLGLEGLGFRDPTEGIKDLTALELLRRGAERIPAEAQSGEDDGATTAVLMDTIGNSLRVLGDYERAQSLLEAAWKARRGSAQPEPRELADSAFHLGILAHEFLDIEAAERRYREAIDLYQGAEGIGSLAVMRVKFRLAWLLAMERRGDEAEKLFREVLRARQAQLGADHPDIQNVQLALMLVMLERGDRLALLAQAQQFFGRNSLVARALITYSRAMAFRLARNYPAAKLRYEEVLVIARKELPARHLILALLLGDMAGMYREIGELDRAFELIREALEIGRRTIPLHPLMIDALTMFADELAKQGRIEEAERHYLEAVDLGKRRSRINPADDRWKKALERLVRMEEDRGRSEKARGYRRLWTP